MDLRFADQDARAMATSLQIAGEGLFGKKNVQVSLFTTDTSGQAISPSRQNIEAAFNKVRSLAKPEDILVIYFSGHGVNYGAGDQGQFYYLTRDISSSDISDEQVRKTRTISSTELTEWIKQIPAMKQVFILDACNSGKVVVDLASGSKDLSASQVRALDRMKDRTGMFVLAGSAADKVSYEATQYGQGLLTYSLLEGMSGLGLTDDKRVDVMTLFQRSRDRVPELAQGIGVFKPPCWLYPSKGEALISVL
ncbi:MAG: caspase family protein [Lewinellaceae bacterium]|nr:caspase family protein [Lewinellaceae bacterium]